MVCSVYVTFSSIEEAEKIISRLIKDKLIACANIIQNVSSIYEWKGKIQTSNEVLAFLKTTDANFLQISAYIKQRHSYDCPCIIKLAIPEGEIDYLNWINSSVK